MREPDINSENNLHYRLLELVPSKLLREYAGEKLPKSKIINLILSKSSIKEIRKFFVHNMGCYKQHVYLFKPEPSVNIKSLKRINIPGSVNLLIDSYRNTNQRIFYYFLKIRKTFVSFINRDFIDIEYYWPFKIVVSRNSIILYFLMLELKSETIKYLNLQERYEIPNKRKIVKNIVDSIIKNLNLKDSKELDINRGIKLMWKKDLIDSPLTQSKGKKSTSLETMDSGLYIKRDYSQMYKNIISRPILKSIFHIMKEKDHYVSRFVVDPSFGRLYFNSFSHQISIENVIKNILQHN